MIPYIPQLHRSSFFSVRYLPCFFKLCLTVIRHTCSINQISRESWSFRTCNYIQVHLGGEVLASQESRQFYELCFLRGLSFAVISREVAAGIETNLYMYIQWRSVSHDETSSSWRHSWDMRKKLFKKKPHEYTAKIQVIAVRIYYCHRIRISLEKIEV